MITTTTLKILNKTITGYDEKGKPIVERAIDADILRQEISAQVVEGPQERYQFTWPDKKKSVVLANQPIAKTLRLDREKSVGRDGTPGSIDTENIYRKVASLMRKEIALYRILRAMDGSTQIGLI